MPLASLRFLISDLIRSVRLLGREDDEAAVKRLFPMLRKPKQVAGITRWKNRDLHYVDAPSVYYQLSDIYIGLAYDFSSENQTPYILDVGAHIGLATLRFRELFPTAKIIAFEPDPQIADCLTHNLAKAADHQTEVIVAAAWSKKGEIGFKSTGDDSGGIDKDTTTSLVPTIELASYCQQTVDFLKLDIEGAEFEVIQHLHHSGVLPNVRRLFLELHHWDTTKIPRFHEALNIIAESGFNYRISSAEAFPEGRLSDRYDRYRNSTNLVVLSAWRHN